MAFTTFTNPVYVGGKPDVSAHYGPWASVQAYLNFVSQELLLSAPVKGTTIGILESGTVVEYWNPTTPTTFIRKAEGGSGQTPSDATITIKQGGITKGSFTLNQSSDATISLDAGGTPTPMDSPIFVIDLDTYGITEGYMSKGTDGHYTSTQYAQMKANGEGITQAILAASQAGFSKVYLPHGTYCFCPVDYHPLNWSAGVGLPSINLYDLNYMDIDLGGSTLCLLVDSTQWSPYICTQGRGSNEPYMSGHILTYLSYCNHITIRNGNFQGDRFIRLYNEVTSTNCPESWNESTYGIMIGAGNEHLSILDCDFTGWMGDGISGQPNSFYFGYTGEEGEPKCTNIVQFKSNNSQVEGWEAFPENTWTRGNNSSPQQTGSCQNTCITPLAVDGQALIDTASLYTTNMSLANRQAHKEARMFQICATGGYNRTVQAYPNLIGVLTYSSIDSAATPLRYIEVGYMGKFKLQGDERYLRLQYTHEDHIAPANKLTLVQNPVFRYKCIKTTSGQFDHDCWERLEYTANQTATYDESTTYKVGDTMYNYQLLKFACTQATSGTWDATAWRVLPHQNPGDKVDYSTTRSYTADQTVTQYAYSGYIPTDATKRGNTLWFTSVSPLIGVGELHTFGVNVERCRFIDSHRGNMSNMPNDTTVKDCYFHKNFHVLGDGGTIPNFSGSVTGIVIKDTTQYSIDIEDYCCTNFRLLNTRFETPDLSTGQILLNSISQVVDGCSGQAAICVYNTNAHSVIQNCFFDRTSFSTFPGNNRTNQSAHRYYRSHIVYANNEAVISSLSGFDPYGRDIELLNNTLQVEQMVNGEYGGLCIPADSSHKFVNNRISALYTPDWIGIGARCSTNDTFIGEGTDIRFASPAKFSGSAMDGGRCTFLPGLDATDIKGLDVKSNDIRVSVPPLVNGNAYTARFTDCSFESTKASTAMMFVYDWQTRQTRPAVTLDVYFVGCEFKSKLASSNNSFACKDVNATTKTGDVINVHFINCTFNTNQQSFCNDSIFSLAECKNCTFTRQISFNGTPLANA